MAVIEVPFAAYDYEVITVNTVVKSLDPTKIAPSGNVPARAALITVENASLRFRLDGNNPTATNGHRLQTGDVLVLVGINNLRNFRAIRDTGTSATIRVSYLR